MQFTAQRHPSTVLGGGVQLVVNGTNARGEMPLQVFLVAPDWATFVRRYPKETNAYLRPVFSELAQEAVFAPDPAVAMQVFPENGQPTPAQINRVLEVLPDLSSPDYHRRDRATAALRAIREDALRVFLHTDRSGLSAEQNLRVEQVLVPMGLLPAGRAQATPPGPGVPARLPLLERPRHPRLGRRGAAEGDEPRIPLRPRRRPGRPRRRGAASCAGRSAAGEVRGK